MGLPLTRLKKFVDWLDERSGIKQALSSALDEPIRGGARWAYVFGSVLVFLFVLQAVSGALLAIYYVPSADHAHTSVSYIQKVLRGGALLRGLHSHTASAMMILLIAHLTQTFLFAAYKQKRELVWIVGGLLLVLLLAFAFTGYLLPWDQDAYFATNVGVSIAGEVPVIGPFQRRLLLGGSDLTSLTLSRFFVLHVLLLPLFLGLLIVLHVYLFRRAGPAGPFHARDDWRVDSFYPRQLLKDSVVILIVFVALMALARFVPARLGPEADPTSDFLARPPWYFLPLFELLKYSPGRLALVATVVVPGVLLALLFLLPFLDKRSDRNPWRRPIALVTFTLLLLGMIGLGALAKYQDRRNPEFRARLMRQEEDARAFLKAPFQPQELGALRQKPVSTQTSAVGEPPAAFEQNRCSSCHGDHGQGAKLGPKLIGVASKPKRSADDLLKLLGNPRAYGLKDPMPASFPKLSQEDKVKIVDWLATLK